MTSIDKPKLSSASSSTATRRSAQARTTVLHLIETLENDAAARETVDLSLLTNRGGWRALVSSAGGALVMDAERTAIRHTEAPLHRHDIFSRWRARLKLEALAVQEHPALVHAHGLATTAHGVGLATLRRLPLLVDLKDPVALAPPQVALLKKAAARGARFRVPSVMMMRWLCEENGIKGEVYHVAPGIDLNWYDAGRISPERLQELCRLWRLPETTMVIMTTTPFTEGQGHAELLQTLKTLNRPDIFTVMVGLGPLRPMIEAQVEQFGLSGRVIMPERCPDWPAACWLASCIVAANVAPRGDAPELLAAQALGRPAIVTDCGANAEFVQSGETAWIVAPRDRAGLAAALNEATRLTTTQRLNLAASCRSFVEARFSQPAWAAAMFELYGAMLAAPMTDMPLERAS